MKYQIRYNTIIIACRASDICKEQIPLDMPESNRLIVTMSDQGLFGAVPIRSRVSAFEALAVDTRHPLSYNKCIQN